MPDQTPWSPRGYDPNRIRHSWSGGREEIVGGYRRLIYGLSDQEIFGSPEQAQQYENQLWQRLSLPEQQALRNERYGFFERLKYLRNLHTTRGERLATGAEQDKGLFGSLRAAAGEVVGGVGALPAIAGGLASAVGLESVGRGIKSLMYDDPGISAGQAARRTRDIFQGAFDPRYLEMGLEGQRDSSELLATAVRKNQERKRLGLPTEMGSELMERDIEIGQRGQEVAARGGIESVGRTVGDIGALVLGTKGLGMAAGAATKVPMAGGVLRGAGNAAQALGRGAVGRGAAGAASTGAAFGLLGVGREESWGAFPREFAFGAGMHGAGSLLGGFGGLMRGRALGGQKTLGLSPGVSTQVGTGMQQLSGRALAPAVRGGRGASAIRAAARGGAETAKLTAGSVAANVYEAVTDEDLTLGDALTRTLHEIPAHAVFGALSAARGRSGALRPESGGKASEAEKYRQMTEEPLPRALPQKRAFESMSAYRERVRREVPAVRQRQMWAERGRGGAQVQEGVVRRTVPGSIRAARRGMEPRTKDEWMRASAERVSKVERQVGEMRKAEDARMALAGERGQEFRKQVDARVEFDRKQRAQEIAERQGFKDPEAMVEATRQQVVEVSRRAESLLANEIRNVTGPQVDEFRREMATMLSELRRDLRKRGGIHQGVITKMWNRTLKKIEAIDPTLAVRAQAQMVRAREKKQPEQWKAFEPPKPKPEFMPETELPYEGMEKKPSAESKLPEPGRPTRGAETALPRPQDLVGSEPVPGEIVREGLKLAYPQSAKGRRFLTRESAASAEGHARFVEQFKGSPKEVAGQALLHARLQGEGLPRNTNAVRGEETFWGKVTEKAGVDAGTYSDALKQYRKAANKEYGKAAGEATKKAKATGAAADHLKGYLAEAAYGSKIGVDHQASREKAINAIAHPAGMLKDESNAAHRVAKAREMVREAELAMGFHEGQLWTNISFAMDARARKLGVWEEGTRQPSEKLYEEMVKGVQAKDTYGVYPWETILNERIRGEFEERIRDRGDAGEVGEGRRQLAGEAGREVPLELRLGMDTLTGYYLGGGIKSGLAKELGVTGDLLRFQKAVADKLVETGLATKGAGEHDYRWTDRGIAMVNDLSNWLNSNKRYRKNFPEFSPPWNEAVERPWDVRCLSPCGAFDGSQRTVEATAKHGLSEGEADRLVDHEPLMRDRLMEWAKGSWRRIKAGVMTDPTELNVYELTKTLKADPKNRGWIRKMVRHQFTPLWQIAPGLVQIGEKEGTHWILRSKQLESLATEGLGKEWVEDKSFIDGKTQPRFERVIDIVEEYGKLSHKDRLARMAEIGEEDWGRVQVIRTVLREMRKDIVQHLYDPIRVAIKRAKATGQNVDEAVGIDLHSLAPHLGVPFDPVSGSRMAWDNKLHREFFRNKNIRVIEEVMQAKELLEPGATTFVKLPNGQMLEVTGYGVRDYFPHVWMKYDLNPFLAQQYKTDISDTTPEIFDGMPTIKGHLRVANGYAKDPLVPQAKRRKFVANWLQRRLDRDGYVKHPAVLMMYLRESYRKIKHERVMQQGEDHLLGEYAPLDISTPAAAGKMLYESTSATTEQSYSSMAGHEVGGNLMMEVRGVFPPRYGKRFQAKGPWKMYIVRNQTKLGMREEGSDKWGADDVIVLHQPGPINQASNYIKLKGREEIQRARLFVRSRGLIQGITGVVENSFLWDRLEEIARGGGPKDWNARRGFLWRAWESIETTLGALGHHAALGGVINSPAAQMNLIEGNLVLNAATNGFQSVSAGWKTMRGFLPAATKRVPMYWKMASEGKSHREIWDAIAKDTLASDPNNAWAKHYERILKKSPYDLGGMHEKNMWAVDVVEGQVGKEESAVTQAMVEARDTAGRWIVKHIDPKMFTSFELSEQHTRQMLYMTAYDHYLKRFGNGAGKGKAPFVNPETGEHFRVIEGEAMRRDGTAENPHLLSAHDLAFGQVMRTHFVYRLAYHPGIMRYRPWRIFGHLGSFGMLQAMERARDVKALYTVPTGHGFQQPDLARFSRGVRHIVASWALYTFMDQVLGMDTGNFIGAHPSDIPGLSEMPWVYGIPNSIRFIPGGIPAGVSTMPAKMGLGTVLGAGRLFQEVAAGRSPSDAMSNQVRIFKDQNRTFFLPFDNGWAIPGGFLTIPFSRSIIGRMGQMLEADVHPTDREKPLRFGPSSRPVSTTYAEMLKRAIFPGSPSSWSEGYRTSRYREGGRMTRQYIRDDLSQRFFRAENQQEMQEIFEEASNLGLGDFANTLKSKARLWSWSPKVRSYSISDPLPVKIKNAIEDADSLTTLERAKVHELIWGKGTPLMSLRPSKLRAFAQMPGLLDLINRYRREFMLRER